MPKAGEVASELRRLADALDKEPEAEVQKPWITFYCNQKEVFLTTSRLLPRPLVKRWDNYGNSGDRLHVENGALGDSKLAIHFDCSIPRSTVCTLVKPAEPAVYECEPLLSEDEEQAVAAE